MTVYCNKTVLFLQDILEKEDKGRKGGQKEDILRVYIYQNLNTNFVAYKMNIHTVYYFQARN